MKAIRLMIILLYGYFAVVSAQKSESLKISNNQIIVDSLIFYDSEPAFVTVDESATFHGGGLGLFTIYIQQHFQFPKDLNENEISGKVTVQFCVDTIGKITDIKILKSFNSIIDTEVVRVISESNKANTWKPAKQGGQTVKQQFEIPICIDLQ